MAISKLRVGCIALLFFLFAYAYWIEPNWIEVTHHSIKLETPQSLKIAHLSDLHIRSIGYRERKILTILEQEKPDVIFITGDSVAEDGNYEAVGNFFGKLHARLGTWTVSGNWEHWRPATQEQNSNADGSEAEHKIYRSAGVKFLNNSSEQLIKGIWVVGIDDAMAGSPNIQKAVKGVPNGVITIGLFHSPSFFDQINNEFNLVFSGHTHGGQVRLPLIAPLWLPDGSGRFIAGWYDRNNSKMYVSRGLGNSILDIRFLCRPELSIVEIAR